MKNIYTVSQVNGYIKNIFVRDMLLNRISIKGEVSNCKYHTSGHIYFTLKDGTSQLLCVMFAGQRSGLAFRMSEGQSVIVSGNVSVYERDGRYQLYAENIQLDGVGQLYEQFERLKAKLLKEGLFLPEHKKQIPSFPKRIGLVTAKTGAALQDMITICHRRNPYVQLVLCPAQVQGFGAAESIAEAVRRLDCSGVDIIIVGRGGGSIEDLWAFNEEVVARAVYDCKTPVISGVGHETDTTMVDYVADLRASTPSAAMELAVCEIQNIYESLAGYHSELTRCLLERLENARKETEAKRLRLSCLSPRYQLQQKREQASQLSQQLRRQMQEHLDRNRHRLAIAAERMKGASPLNRLSQGYSYVSNSLGENLTSIEQAKTGEEIRIAMRDGSLLAMVTEKIPENRREKQMEV